MLEEIVLSARLVVVVLIISFCIDFETFQSALVLISSLQIELGVRGVKISWNC